MTAQLQSTLQSLEPALKEKLRKIIAEREVDVETMKGRTTPWKTLIEEEDEDDGRVKIAGRIKRIDGVGKATSGDGLEKIERWAEEIVRFARFPVWYMFAEMSEEANHAGSAFEIGDRKVETRTGCKVEKKRHHEVECVDHRGHYT